MNPSLLGTYSEYVRGAVRTVLYPSYLLAFLLLLSSVAILDTVPPPCQALLLGVRSCDVA